MSDWVMSVCPQCGADITSFNFEQHRCAKRVTPSTDDALNPPFEVRWTVTVTDPEVARRLVLELDNLAAKYISQISGVQLQIGNTIVKKST